MKIHLAVQALREWWATPDPGAPRAERGEACPGYADFDLHVNEKRPLTRAQSEHTRLCAECGRKLCLFEKYKGLPPAVVILFFWAGEARAAVASAARQGNASQRQGARGGGLSRSWLLAAPCGVGVVIICALAFARAHPPFGHNVTAGASQHSLQRRQALTPATTAAAPSLLPGPAVAPQSSSRYAPPVSTPGRANRDGSAAAQSQSRSRTADGGTPSLLINRIGGAATGSPTQDATGPRIKVVSYYVNYRDIIGGSLVGSLPPDAVLHPLVRRTGEQRWEVQTGAFRTPRGGDGAEWKVEVRFGSQADSGGLFELRVAATRERLPSGYLSFDTISRNALALSEIVRVRRRVEGTTVVWIPYVNNIAVYGNELKNVQLQAPVEVRARDLPPEAQLGVVVQPIKPWTDHHWVMDGSVASGHGVIYAHFGRLGLDNFHEFEVTAFAAYPEDFPQRGVGIPQAAWEALRQKFLAESRIVGVIRWEGEFKIIDIGGNKVTPRVVLAVDEQADINGAVDVPLKGGERVWIICLTRRADVWVAGWTATQLPAGRWVVNAAQLWREGQPRLIDVVAVVSDADLAAKGPAELRAITYQLKHTMRSVRVLTTGDRAR